MGVFRARRTADTTYEMRACRRCGTSLEDGRAWCPLCLSRALDIDDDALVAELQESLHPRTGWIAEWIHREPAPPKEFSRWRAGPLSFGPLVKSVMTLAVAYITFDAIRAAISNLFVLLILPLYLGFTGFAMHAIWRKERIR